MAPCPPEYNRDTAIIQVSFGFPKDIFIGDCLSHLRDRTFNSNLPMGQILISHADK